MNSIRLIAYISLVLLVLFSATAGFPKEEIIESKWTAQPPRIDGLNDDWSEDVLTSEKGVKVDYAVRNDAQNLYVLFVFKDPKSLSSIDATGITLYFNREGKKKKDHGVHFIKKQVTADELIASLEKQGEVLTEEQRQMIKSKPAIFMLDAEMVGKKGPEASETTPIPGTLRPAFRTTQKGNEVIYEFRVPLARPETFPWGIGAEPGQNVNIGFEWGGMTDEMRKAMNARARAESDQGVASESSAGNVIVTDRDDSRASRRPSTGVPKKYSFWVDVKLAQNQ